MESGFRTSDRWLLVCGMIAGPLFLAVGLVQVFLREGFDLGRHPLSLLSNGPGGWVQTANFVLTGLLVVAAAIGLARALRGQSRAAGWFLGTFGASMLVAAVFPADPMDGFPPGTPEGTPTEISTAGLIHFIAGAIGFVALAVSCFVVAHAMARQKQRWVAHLASGVAILLGFFAPVLIPASGPVAGIWFSVIVGWTWLALTSLGFFRRAPSPLPQQGGRENLAEA